MGFTFVTKTNHICCTTFVIFTARSSYASKVLGIVILSVRLLCDETIEHTADILTNGGWWMQSLST